MRSRIILTICVSVLWTFPGFAQDAAQIEFFEKKIRPILADNCYNCHGPKKQNAGLRLDSREGLLKGSDAGPVVIGGKPDDSLLIKSVRYQGDYKMPPKAPLAPEAVNALVEWVKMGAPFPATSTAKVPTTDDAARNHWAFRPIHRPALPNINHTAQARNDIDRFLLAALEAKGLSYGAEADRRTLIRRAYFDLIGLPPTPAEVDAFLADRDPKAYEKLIDRLLQSPHYGERWARYWMDLSRYADTKGYVFQEDRNYPYAYTYRDYLIRSFNEDKPYDRFLIEQLAADQLNLGNDPSPLAAMGFLTLGRRFLNNTHDIIDDRIDVVTRGLLGLTVTCSRCHDHKFDPIPQKDYYSLYGVFASSIEPKEPPLIAPAKPSPELVQFEAELKKRQDAVTAYLTKRHGEIVAEYRKADKLQAVLAVVRNAQQRGMNDLNPLVREQQVHLTVVQRWRDHIRERGKAGDPVWALWAATFGIPDADWAKQAPVVVAAIQKTPNLNPAMLAVLKDFKPATFADVANLYARLFERSLTDQSAGLDAFRNIIAEGPGKIPFDQAENLMTQADDRRKFRELKANVDSHRAKSPAAPPRAMVLNDAPTPSEPVVFLRGNPGNRGPAVKRQFLEILSGPERKPFAKGSGRLEMAQAIASKDNPLTARVFVNRVWTHHFGRGLVITPSDFGVRTEKPSHPELLDHLAAKFISDGWSIKQLHREIMLSAAYRQRSDDRPELKVDPENRLLGRMNRRRLDFEAMRDSLLAVSGELDPQIGGRSVDIFAQPFSKRRSVYAHIDRQNLPGTLRTFDFALPDTHSPQRFQTTVPQQALFLMNSPFVIQQAKALIARPNIAEVRETSRKLETLYRFCYGRNPTDSERAMATKFLSAAPSKANELAAPRWQYGYGSINIKTRRLGMFTPLPHWTGSSYQGGPNLPDAKLGWCILNANGGHPGNDPRFAVVRRWVSPVDGVYRISGKLTHPSPMGDGVRTWIITEGNGIVGSFEAANRATDTNVIDVKVRAGQTIDFIVDCNTNPNHDAFQWSFQIRSGNEIVADSVRDFGAVVPAEGLTPWEELAQVLLLSNEFAFID